MNSDITKKTFNAQLAKAVLGIYRQYAVFISHCLIRVGFEPVKLLLEKTLLDKTDSFTSKILNYDWAPSKEKIDFRKEKQGIILKYFSDDILKIESVDRRYLEEQINKLYPLNQILKKIGDEFQLEYKMAAYEYFHLVYDGYAKLVEALIGAFRKEGELIAYDIEKKIRLAKAPQGGDNDIEQFMKDFIDLEKNNDLFSASLICTVKHSSKSEVVKEVNKCEYARYFRDHHPEVGYLIACSSDETEYLDYNSRLRMRRTRTLMEGADCCDFHVFTI